MPSSMRALDGQPRAHLLYLHVEKTGGSSIECATQHQFLVERGFFTNLGHTSRSVADGCRGTCAHEGERARTVITVREPYAWWRSLYTVSEQTKRHNGRHHCAS